MFKLIGLIICCASIAVVIDAKGSFMMYLDITALVLLFGITLAGIIVGYGKQSIHYFMMAGKKQISPKELLPALNFFNYISHLTFYSSICAFLISAIVIISNTNDPKMLGPALALSLLNIIYGLTLSFIIIQPLKHGILLKRLKAAAIKTVAKKGK